MKRGGWGEGVLCAHSVARPGGAHDRRSVGSNGGDGDRGGDVTTPPEAPPLHFGGPNRGRGLSARHGTSPAPGGWGEEGEHAAIQRVGNDKETNWGEMWEGGGATCIAS